MFNKAVVAEIKHTTSGSSFTIDSIYSSIMPLMVDSRTLAFILPLQTFVITDLRHQGAKEACTYFEFKQPITTLSPRD